MSDLMKQLAELRRNSKQATQIIQDTIISGQKKSYNDDRFWKPEVDKEGNGIFIIRFLPSKYEAKPFVKVYNHGFRSKEGKWYIEKCPKTKSEDEPCPVCEYINQLYSVKNSQPHREEEIKKIIEQKSKKLSYISNILVINDPNNINNNGKVFLFSYKKTVFEMLVEALFPKFGEAKFNPFDLDSGAPFYLRMYNKGSNNFSRSYDKSKFGQNGPVYPNDEQIAEILNKTYSLTEFIDSKNILSYDKMREKFGPVIGDIGNNISSPPPINNLEQRFNRSPSLPQNFDDDDLLIKSQSSNENEKLTFDSPSITDEFDEFEKALRQ